MPEPMNALAALQQAVERGTLSPEELSRRLEALIEAEYAKPDADLAFIRACEDLLKEMHLEAGAPSANARYLGLIRQQACTDGRHVRLRPVFRAAAVLAAAALFLLLVGGIRFSWFTGLPSVTGEQYIIQGHEVTLEMIQHAMADIGQSELRFKTDDPAQVEARLGFMPPIPQPDMLGAVTRLISVTVLPDNWIDVVVLYHDAQGEGAALYSVTYYLDMESFYFSVEQSSPGVYVDVDGVSVYCTDNLARRTYVWVDDRTAYTLSGFINDDVAFRIVREIMK